MSYLKGRIALDDYFIITSTEIDICPVCSDETYEHFIELNEDGDTIEEWWECWQCAEREEENKK